jgi:hypothetical protein
MNILQQIAPRALRSQTPFLMIGGNAVIAHGFPRQTVDLDLLIQTQDRAAWHDLVTSLGYVPYHLLTNFLMYNAETATMPPLDFMLVSSETFAKLASDAIVVSVAGEQVKIPSLRHLIALKLHALRSGESHRHERDMLDVVTLLQLHGIELASPDYAEIFQRYATEAVRAEINRRLAGPGSSGP